jgi:hypothetical protein
LNLTPHVHFEYDATHKVLAVRAVGDMDDEVFKACYAMVGRLVQGMDVRAAFFDLTNVGRFNVSAATVRYVSTLSPVLPDPTPRYVIASQDHIYGMARMFQIVSTRGRDNLRVVRTQKDAYEGLGLTAGAEFQRVAEPPDVSP